MDCPNCVGVKLTYATQNVEFEDSKDNSIATNVTLVWCANCKYIHEAY